MVDGRLSTHRRIDLGEQRGWYLHIPDASLVARRHIACDVPDDTAAHSNDRTIAVVTAVDETIDHLGKCLETLEFFTITDFDHVKISVYRGSQSIQIQVRDGCIRYHRHLGTKRVEPRCLVAYHPRPDEDTIPTILV